MVNRRSIQSICTTNGVTETVEQATENTNGKVIIVDTGDLTLYNKIKESNEFKTISIKNLKQNIIIIHII